MLGKGKLGWDRMIVRVSIVSIVVKIPIHKVRLQGISIKLSCSVCRPLCRTTTTVAKKEEAKRAPSKRSKPASFLPPS